MVKSGSGQQGGGLPYTELDASNPRSARPLTAQRAYRALGIPTSADATPTHRNDFSYAHRTNRHRPAPPRPAQARETQLSGRMSIPIQSSWL
ncbi:hypothetical protein GKJPGBOP_00392 [Streptomyces paromomycinus]|uniref:Uncharacterized protein n=1 Tax=Streptomyces paromomycinus TaxID=92743 RepID=A0A401VUJ5_STREY|nr:hypothetical protein GKJPGBOP_00392 [Streptomyces paromomycinus]